MPTYTCSMHPEVQQATPGQCPKCHMKLVVRGSAPVETKNRYTPLFTIVGLITLVTATIAYRDMLAGAFVWQNAVSNFMIGFFLVFAGFKLIDLKGFVEGYSTYDLLAQRIRAYGYVYPFIELFFGLAMILTTTPALLIAEFLVMSFSGLGVAIKLAKREKFQCVCLGTFLKVPLTKITLVEDFGMALLALILIMFGF